MTKVKCTYLEEGPKYFGHTTKPSANKLGVYKRQVFKNITPGYSYWDGTHWHISENCFQRATDLAHVEAHRRASRNHISAHQTPYQWWGLSEEPKL